MRILAVWPATQAVLRRWAYTIVAAAGAANSCVPQPSEQLVAAETSQA